MIVIGVDPDSVKSGYGVVDTDLKVVIGSGKFGFVELFEWISDEALTHGNNLRVVVEAGWMNKGNWHVQPRTSVQMAAAIGRKVGMNHQTGVLLVKLLRNECINVEEVRPLRKIWDGKDRKITADELKAFTGYDKRTNQDERDAILLAWEYSGLPIGILKQKNKNL